ncbi:MAG: hypothetical protein GY797_01550 [Deltaproteobacteria bacterium]|nr:hypothetical protein [Deltaproteobacteria bacterium]
MKKETKYRDIPIPHKVYPITGFVLSGYIFWFPGLVKLPDPDITMWKSMKIPDQIVKPVYIGLEIWRKLKNLCGIGLT